MALTLQSRFLVAEEQFLSAFTRGPQALSAFQGEWDALSHEFQAAVQLQEADAETRSLAHAVASRLAILADNFLSLDTELEDLSETYSARCAEVLSQADDHASSLSHHQRLRDLPSLGHDIASDTSSSLHSIAHRWLLSNLHDPYPPKAQLVSIAESCGSPVKTVQHWFAEARRSIGWTALSQTKFGGNRRATSEAARLVYADDGAAIPLPSDIVGAFVAIRVNAHAFQYHFHYGKTSLSGREGSIKQLAFEGVSDEGAQAESDELAAHFVQSTPLHTLHSPSTPSPTMSLVPLSFEEEDTTPPPAIAGRKRRFDDAITEEQDLTSITASSGSSAAKRHRYMSPSSGQDMWNHAVDMSNKSMNIGSTFDPLRPNTCSIVVARSDVAISSPATEAPLTPPDATIVPTASPTSPPITSSHVSRKRRLSDAAYDLPKRPRHMVPGPRKQVVSDPIPFGLNPGALPDIGIDAWLQTDTSKSIESDSSVFDVIAPCNETAISVPFLKPLLPTSRLNVSDADILSATHDGFDLSSYDSNLSIAFDPGFFLDSDLNTFDDSSARSPSSTSSSSGLSDYGLPYHTHEGSTEDWSQFLNILDSLGPSPTPSQSSLQDLPSAPQLRSDPTSLTNAGDISHTLFGLDSPFTSSDLLSDIGGFSFLHMPLEATS